MSTARFPKSLEEAEAFDQADPLATAREAFALPDDITYLVGHSLGPAPRAALAQIETTAHSDWSSGLVGSWNTADWINLPQTTGAKIAPLLGVQPDEVIVCDSVSLNIFKLASALLETGKYRPRLCVEQGEFPTDQYMVSRLGELVHAEFVHASSESGLYALREGGILVKSLVDYRTGRIADVMGFEQTALESGGAIIWDLSHATGILDLKLPEWNVIYGVGCTYKYLNGGPGAPGFIYVSRDWQSGLTTPLPGWLGHARPFAFEPGYEPGAGLKRFVSGTPGILSMSALNAALDVFEGLALSDLQKKANCLGDMCLSAFANLGLQSTSPPIGTMRGGHVSVRHSQGYAVSQALAARGHKTDFRTPDTIRWGLSPLYLSYAEVWQALKDFEDILVTKEWQEEQFQTRNLVT
ncbi:MAG: hypothetical protein CMK09_10545 [Ponticaulis sp.]|nr:hypothetical protein [Ponticaulis sp.]|tara:strand:- start:16699 stop:17931 length:1233 start_codon:yes stop_codon:yes gene_type:complete